MASIATQMESINLNRSAISAPLDNMQRRGLIRRWQVERDYNAFGWRLRLEYPDGRYREHYVDRAVLESREGTDYFIESVRLTVLSDVEGSAMEILRNERKQIYRDQQKTYGDAITYGQSFSVTEYRADNPEPVKAKPLSPSNAYRFDYLEFTPTEEKT